MNDFRRQWQDVRDEVLRAVDATGESGWYVLGEQVLGFEAALAHAWPLPHAVGVASGLDALELALRGAGLRPGDLVLTTPLSAFATTMAITRLGAIPVFVDTDENGLLDLAAARLACEQNPEIRYIVPVHLYGFPIDLDALEILCASHRLICIEDCAQSIGATGRGGRPTGTVGVAAATSFYPTKNLGALGDGGAMLTSDPTLASRVRRLRDYGQDAKYRHAEIGYNSRLDELHAAILNQVFLPRLAAWTQRRRDIAARYRANWKSNLVQLLPGTGSGTNPCWHLFPVRVAPQRKPALIQWLREHGIGCGEHYPIAIPDQTALIDVRHRCQGDLTVARQLAAGQLSLPIHPYLEDHEVDEVLHVVHAWQG